MSIWASVCTFGYIAGFDEGWPPHLDDQPYSDYMNATDHYVDKATLNEAERGGFVDLAFSNLCDLYRLSLEHPDKNEHQLWLDRRQLARLHAAIGQLLNDTPPDA